jgi:phenylalanyl-tRNA synthetase beta chain
LQEQRLGTRANPIRLLNPIASQLNVMRSQLLGSLLQALRYNLDRKAGDVRLFELGRVFSRNTESVDGESSVAGVAQPMRLAGLAYGNVAPAQWAEKVKPIDFFDVKADVEALLGGRATFAKADHPALHPGRAASISLDGALVGYLGELHPQWRQAYDFHHAPVLFELDAQAAAGSLLPVASKAPKLQVVERDIAVVVGAETSFAQLMTAANIAQTQGLLSDMRLFDIYRPKAEGGGMSELEKSCALRLSFSAGVRTLTDAEIDGAVAQVLAALQKELGARLRS